MEIERGHFEAIGYIFEKANGRGHDGFEDGQIAQSPFRHATPDGLAERIVDILDEGPDHDARYRTAAYWALSKREDHGLLPKFQRWLRREAAEKDPAAVFQLMIALDNLDEPIFAEDRDGSYSALEEALNLRDAGRYLEDDS